MSSAAICGADCGFWLRRDWMRASELVMAGRCADGGVSREAGDQLGVAALRDVVDGFLEDAVGFCGGERVVEGLKAGEYDVVGVAVAEDAGVALQADGFFLQSLGLLAEADELVAKPG